MISAPKLGELLKFHLLYNPYNLSHQRDLRLTALIVYLLIAGRKIPIETAKSLALKLSCMISYHGRELPDPTLTHSTPAWLTPSHITSPLHGLTHLMSPYPCMIRPHPHHAWPTSPLGDPSYSTLTHPTTALVYPHLCVLAKIE